MVLVTAFTPTYNRAGLLPRLFDSLCAQTCKDFEWLIVDDGSTDNTGTIVETFRKSDLAGFPIKYIKKANGGKHTAINLGVQKAQGELFFIADSDDVLPPDSIGNVIKQYIPIQNDESFAGICGLDADFDRNIIGSGLPKAYIDATSIGIRFLYKVSGDLKEVFKTAILKEFPFPELPNERFCPEALVWNRIAQKYSLRFFNKAIYLAEYQQGGLTDNIVRIRMKSPIATMMTYAETTEYKGVPLKSKIRAAINYWRFWFCKKAGSPAPHISAKWLWAMPLGWLMHKRDCKNTALKTL